jgi:hypothetical protein
MSQKNVGVSHTQNNLDAKELPTLVNSIARRCATYVRGRRLGFKIRVYGLKKTMVIWEIYNIMTHGIIFTCQPPTWTSWTMWHIHAPMIQQVA